MQKKEIIHLQEHKYTFKWVEDILLDSISVWRDINIKPARPESFESIHENLLH